MNHVEAKATAMNSVDVKPTSSGHILVTIKTGEIVQAQANLDMMQAWTMQKEILSAIEKLTVDRKALARP